MNAREYASLVEGTTIAPLRYGTLKEDGTRVTWTSGTIQFFDDAGAALAGFAAAVACTVSADTEWLEWTPAYGTGSGQLRDITANQRYRVRWRGVPTTGGLMVAKLIDWRLEPA